MTRANAIADREPRPGRDTVFARAAARATRRLPEADRFALAKAVVDLDPGARAVMDRALASGAPIRALLALAHQWPTVSESERAIAVSPLPLGDEGPVELDGVPARQVDATTCGAASMAIMLMMGDPFVGAWVASGRRFGGYLPPEIRAIPPQARLDTVERRWGALQKAIHLQTVRRGLLLLLPWPERLGTPPWRVNNATRFAGLAFRGAVVDIRERVDEGCDVLAVGAVQRDRVRAGQPELLGLALELRLQSGSSFPSGLGIVFVGRAVEFGGQLVREILIDLVRLVRVEVVGGVGTLGRGNVLDLPAELVRLGLAVQLVGSLAVLLFSPEHSPSVPRCP